MFFNSHEIFEKKRQKSVQIKLENSDNNRHVRNWGSGKLANIHRKMKKVIRPIFTTKITLQKLSFLKGKKKRFAYRIKQACIFLGHPFALT